MKIDPQKKLRDNIFYNNLCIIICIFCIACFATAIFFQSSAKKHYVYDNLKEGTTIGPIKVANKSAIFKMTAYFNGKNTSTYISGEVLDKDKDTLYEFGKDLWHESGHDADGYWSESDRKMTAYLTFKDKGVYYIQLFTDNNTLSNLSVRLDLKSGSYVAHYEAGTLFLLLVLIVGYSINKKWADAKRAIITERIGDAL